MSLAIIAALSMPIGYGCVSVLYYVKKEEIEEPLLHIKAPKYIQDEKRIRRIHRCNVAIGCLIAISSLIVGYFFNSGKINPKIEYVRTTGVDASTWELTYEEIEKLDAGSFFSPDCAGEKIPLLSEAAVFARENNIRLNIELKPTGYETDFEKSVVDIIKQNKIEDRCVITSQVYDVLKNVKAYDETITTVYVMSLAYGDINQLTAADHFSVEATNATKNLISQIHNAGKELYVWTVNTRESILKMAELNVDNIITDNVELARQCIYESKYSDLLTEYIKLFQ